MTEIKKDNINLKRRPQVNTNCIGCWSCINVAPIVFEYENGLAKAKRLDNYEWKMVDDAINICPMDAISWIEMK